MRNAGRVIQQEGRGLGQSIIFLEGFLETPIISQDVAPSRVPGGRIRPVGAFPQLLPAPPGGAGTSPASAMSAGSPAGRAPQTEPG